MTAIKRVVRGFYKLLLPTTVFLILAYIGAAIWLISKSTVPPNSPYIITPEKFGLLSTRAAKITEETWTNQDGTQSRGWLLRGAEGAPAVLLFHQYGADRSWVLNLGVKINEATDATILMPDLRGHGENPFVKWTSLGGSESDDALAAIEYVKSLKTENNAPLVKNGIGLYGVELGALVALSSAAKDPSVKVLALDTVPGGSNALLRSVIGKRFPFASFLTSKIAQSGISLYFYKNYNQESACETAKKLSGQKVFLLANNEAYRLQASTVDLVSCFPNQANIDQSLHLTVSGYNTVNAPPEVSGAYDLRVVDFFKKSFSPLGEPVSGS